MKKTITRSLCAILLLAMLVPMMSVMAGAEGDTGMIFMSALLSPTAKFLEEAPNTFEFTVRLPKGFTERPGVIFSNYVGPEKTHDNAVCIQLQTNGTVQLYYETADFSNVKYVFKNLDICTGDWVHIAVTRDELAGKVSCYINGELAEEQTTTVAPYGFLTSAEELMPMCIGGDYRSNNRYYFRGELRELVVYSDVRDAVEIRADYISTYSTNDNLLAWYQLTGDTIYPEDLSGNGYSVPSDEEPETTEPETEVPVVTDEATEAPVVTDEATTEAPVVTDEPTDAPEATDAPVATDAPEQTTAPAREEKGCGGMIAGAVAVIALLGTAIVFKKKD